MRFAYKGPRIQEEKTGVLIRAAVVPVLAMALAVLALALAGCGSSPPSPTEVVENYLNTIAEGDYADACAQLGAQVRKSLVEKTGSRDTCSQVFALCLPNEATKLERDQTQLFFVNAQVSIVGAKADVRVSGTAVANQIREVTLENRRGVWRLTSSGKPLEACVLKRLSRQHRKR